MPRGVRRVGGGGRVVVAAADIGGVVGPVAAGGSSPLDGDADVDAEEAGEDRGRELSHPRIRQGSPKLLGFDAFRLASSMPIVVARGKGSSPPESVGKTRFARHGEVKQGCDWCRVP